MKVLVILAHPDEGSFNYAIYQRVCQTLARHGHEVMAHDLYREDFPAVIPAGESARGAVLPELVARHCDDLAQAQGIVIVHPNWWGQPPAILTGWVDRVVRPGLAYEFVGDDSGEGVPVGLLKARFAIVLNTSNTDPAREEAVFGDPLERIWKDCIFGLCGVGNFQRRTFGIVITSTAEQRKQWLAETQEIICEAVAGNDDRV